MTFCSAILVFIIVYELLSCKWCYFQGAGCMRIDLGTKIVLSHIIGQCLTAYAFISFQYNGDECTLVLQVERNLLVVIIVAYQFYLAIQLLPQLGGVIVQGIQLVKRIARLLITIPFLDIAIALQTVLQQPFLRSGLVGFQSRRASSSLETVRNCGAVPVERCLSFLRCQGTHLISVNGLINACTNKTSVIHIHTNGKLVSLVHSLIGSHSCFVIRLGRAGN